MTDHDFPFVVSNGPRLQNDPAIRTMIRKQAMKDVGRSRRKRRKSARDADCTTDQIQRVSPATEETPQTRRTGSSESSRSADGESEYDELLPLADTLGSPVTLSSGYQLARSRYRVDITDLSMLTNFNVGRGVISVLGADPSNLTTLLSSRTWSYMEDIPARYGTSDCLTAATDCLLAKVRSVLDPQFGREMTMRSYAEALRTLQSAISDETRCMDADVLCATELLSLHELLDPGRQSAWDQHVDGCTQLIRNRSPQRFQTEFEKALFAAHVGPSISAALLQDTACYVSEPEWLALFRSLAIESNQLTDRSPLTINIRSIMCEMPACWKAVDDAVKGDDLFDDTVLEALAGQCRELQRQILAWTEDYKNHCVRLSLSAPSANELAMRRELFGLSLECLVIFKRLLATLCDRERESLEVQVQAVAGLLLDLQNQPASKHSWLFSGHEVGVAYTVQFTKEQWETPSEYMADRETRLATRRRYVEWSRMLRN